MSSYACKQTVCDILCEKARQDKSIVVLCSDSRGSASMAPFAERFPEQFVEVGIAEQNLVSIAAGLASCGKKAFAVSPACFLSTRSMEQIKVDVAYSHFNVKLIGISGGVSYGSLGMTHHSCQDIAAMSAIPGMRVFLPSDRFVTTNLLEDLLEDEQPAYIRVGRNAVEDVHSSNKGYQFQRAVVAREGGDACIIACGELVKPAVDAAQQLASRGIGVRVLDMYSVKPIDTQAVLDAAKQTRRLLTVEEHSLYGGLGSQVGQIVSEHCPVKVKSLAFPDEPVVTGTSAQVFQHYGMDAEGIAQQVLELLQHES